MSNDYDWEDIIDIMPEEAKELKCTLEKILPSPKDDGTRLAFYINHQTRDVIIYDLFDELIVGQGKYHQMNKLWNRLCNRIWSSYPYAR